uniref:Uncharacterized protein n=1 Tax=Glossina brevipalpis TaxID=37001 RepID=A0A1A9WZH8_9MUSC
MELRSTRQKSDRQDLETILKGLGLHEENMEVREMRQLLSALQLSVDDTLAEGETEFMSKCDDGVFNSTMLKQHNARESEENSESESVDNCSSEEVMKRIIVEAQVHHSMDWTPPTWNEQEGLQPTHTSATDPASDNNSFSTCKNCKQHYVGEVEQLETGNEHFHEQRGPVSMLQYNDSQDHSISSSFSMSGSTPPSSSGSQVGEYRLKFSTSSVVVSDQQDSSSLNETE